MCLEKLSFLVTGIFQCFVSNHRVTYFRIRYRQLVSQSSSDLFRFVWGLVSGKKIIVESNFFFLVSWYCIFKATGSFSVTLENLKQQADEFGLEGKDRTKFLKQEWRKIQDAKLEKEHFEREERLLEKQAAQIRFEVEATEKRLQREVEEKRLEREKEMEERRLERENEMEERRLEREAKLQSEKLAAQLQLERLQLEKAKMERKNIAARAKVQPAASSQASQDNVAAVTKTPGLPGSVDGKDNLDNYLSQFERYAIIAG